ncbi:hypothetical protein L9F63_024306, partial [Diploptera punctata]
ETGNILNFCEVGLKISGGAPINSQAAIHFPNTSLASVSMATTERHTVAFLGTSDGKLKKGVCSIVRSVSVTICINLSPLPRYSPACLLHYGRLLTLTFRRILFNNC